MKTAEEFINEWFGGEPHPEFDKDYNRMSINYNGLVEMLTEYANQSKWIDVKTKPPIDENHINLSIDVIGWDCEDGISIQCFYDFDQFEWYSINGYLVNITHWMELPNPPTAP